MCLGFMKSIKHSIRLQMYLYGSESHSTKLGVNLEGSLFWQFNNAVISRRQQTHSHAVVNVNFYFGQNKVARSVVLCIHIKIRKTCTSLSMTLGRVRFHSFNFGCVRGRESLFRSECGLETQEAEREVADLECDVEWQSGEEEEVRGQLHNEKRQKGCAVAQNIGQKSGESSRPASVRRTGRRVQLQLALRS